jgi:NAD+ kinase
VRLALVVHPSRREAALVAGRVVAEAARLGMTVTATPHDCDRIPGCTERSDDGPDDADVVVAVGGDGTVLQAVRLALAADVPVLGVNAGTVGFLTQAEPDGRLPEAIEALAAGDYTESRRMTLEARLPGRGPEPGLNDVVVEKAISQHVVKVALSVGPERLVEYRADAVIVATPTGSTAYTFSAGGPLVDPELDALIVSAVAPHTLFSRPIVFRPGVRLRLEVVDDRPARVNVDGRPIGELAPGDVVEVVRGESEARFITLIPRNFATSVRHKFHLHDA